MEPWEALDVDDSDLPSLLRPCKRHRDPISTATGISTSISQPPLLVSCSNSSKTPVHNEAAAAEVVVESFRYDSREQRHLIPGPAGVVQAAMLQKNIDRQNHDLSSSQCANPIATQEYIRRAVEEDAPEFDDDFSKNPWISALQFMGLRDGVVPSIPLSAIKESKIVAKAEQVVAVIKSCTQNSLGGMMVTLKDPTGTIGASVHPKVLGESNFAEDFCVGSAVILQKVAIFSPSTSVHYLNITPRNVLKVFNKDIGLPSQQNGGAHSLKYAVPAGSLEKVTPELESCQVMNEMTIWTDNETRSHHVNQIEEEVLLPRSSKCSSRSSFNKNVTSDNDPKALKQDSAQGLLEAAVIRKTTVDKQGSPGVIKGHQKLCNSQDSMTNDSAKHLMMNQIQLETQGDNIVQNQNQQLLAAASLPKWTDEQLAELFAGDDDENDDSFF